MKKNLFFYITLATIIFSCAKDEFQQEIEAAEIDTAEADLTIDKISSKEDVNNLIFSALAEERVFKWSELNVDDLWEVIKLSNHQVDVFWRMDDSSSKTENDIENIILSLENAPTTEEASPIFYIDKEFHYLSATILNKETIEALLNSGKVEIIEPYYEMVTDEELNAQPANKPNNQSLSSRSSDKWRLPGVAFNRPFSWSAVGAGADVAWERGFNGRGATLAVVDVGVEEGHPLLGNIKKGTQFQYINDPVTGTFRRRFRRMSTYPNCFFPWDWGHCNDDGFSYGTPIIGLSKAHGSAMMSMTSGVPNHRFYKPRSNEEYWGTGVAFGADLVSLRASHMYFIQGAKRKIGVRRAFKHLANLDYVKVVSMSMGTFWHDTGIERAVKKAHRSGKMIFTAAGTAPRNVAGINLAEPVSVLPPAISNRPFTLFPSNLKEVYAVTGVFRNTWCYACFGKSEFTVNFEEANIQFDEGSSSRATAVIAGIATLIWGSNPRMSRSQVYNIMRQLSQYPGKKHPDFGRGTIDLSGFYGAKKPIRKAKKVRFYSPDFSNSYFTLGKLDRNGNANVYFNKNGLGDNRQQFKVIELREKNTIALKAPNNRYLGIDKNGNLKASGLMIGKSQKFIIYTNNDGQKALRCIGNNKFITFENASNGSPVRCISPTADKFTWLEMR